MYEECGDCEEEGRRPLIARKPVTPSQREIEEHMRTHIPYRSWCVHCVCGRGRNDRHRRAQQEERPEKVTPEVHMDYGFLKLRQDGSEDKGSKPILVLSEGMFGPIAAMGVPGKGTATPWVAKRVAKWIDDLGHKEVSLKFDNEPPIVALAEAIRRERADGTTTRFENPEEGEKESNARAEGAVNVAKGMIRTLKASTEARLKIKIDENHPLVP